jgi:DNA-binding response OmpR family regulator
VKGRICIVDHDLASRGFLRECLEKEGHDVVILDSGFQVKPLLNGEGFNVFILSIDTPGVREKNLLLQLKKTWSSRILLMVSERGDPFLKEAIDLGVYGFIYKPFNPAEICTMVSHLIR